VIGTAGYFLCLGGAAGSGFAYGILDKVFNIGGGTAGGVYHSLACNSIAQSRWAMEQYCQPVLNP
jgi:hypothetical protein